MAPQDRADLLAVIAAAGTRDRRVLARALPWIAHMRELGLNDRAMAAALLALVQRLPHAYEPPGEWYQSVWRTLTHGGICHDLSPALVCLLWLADIPANVLWVTQEGQPFNHVTVIVDAGAGSEWAEPVVPGARLGENPWAAAHRLGRAAALGLRADGRPGPAPEDDGILPVAATATAPMPVPQAPSGRLAVLSAYPRP